MTNIFLEGPAHAAGSVPVVAPQAADGVFALLWLIIALPLLGAVVLLAVAPVFPKAFDRFGHYLGTALAGTSFLLSLVLFIQLLGRDDSERQIRQSLFTWFESGTIHIGMDLLYDPLSALFLLLITGVGSLIHVYSIGYMEHDARRRRFFGYLNLFVASMLTVVLAANFVVLFLGWEGVGLASYLLIGFWQHKPSAAAAQKKAFITNRVGDVGLSLGIAAMFATFGTTDFAHVSELSQHASTTMINVIGFLLLLAACAKSAQVPLQGWLLDAMEGPTPVSALIHAATMVTAGVYLVVRANFVYEYAEWAQLAVVIVGTVTLLAGAIIGCAKDDIKRVLAGSTMSQIGYMMLAAGLGPVGYPFAIFHLLTHGFFKANMFLGAGSVMHGMNDEVDMRRYGALTKAMPITFVTFAMGYLAIIGFPGFSGFWSKDKIIESALADNIWVGLLALLGAGITGYYMTRLMVMTFTSAKRWDAEAHPHESPKVMTVPLIVLAALSVLGGVMLAGNWIVDFLSPVTGVADHHEPPLPAIVITIIITLVVAAGVALAWFTLQKSEIPREAPQDVSFLTRAARQDLYGDAINDAVFSTPGRSIAGVLDGVDRHVVDGVIEGGSAATGGLSEVLRKLQNGFVRSYALSLLAGALLVVVALMAVNLG